MARQQKTETHPLDALVAGDIKQVIGLMLWKNRHRNPDCYAQIDEKDVRAYRECMEYLKVEPDVMIKRPQGLPAQAAIPAAANRRAVLARDATPAKPYVIVALVERATENAIRPVENNQEDYDIAQDAAHVRKARDQGPMLAERLLQQARSGEYSLSDIQDAANALMLLARADLR